MLFHEGRVLMHGSPAEVFGNRAALKQTNLEPPAVLELFESLCKKGILKSSLPLPKNLKALEQYIAEVNLNPHYGGKKIMSNETRKAILAVASAPAITIPGKSPSMLLNGICSRPSPITLCIGPGPAK